MVTVQKVRSKQSPQPFYICLPTRNSTVQHAQPTSQNAFDIRPRGSSPSRITYHFCSDTESWNLVTMLLLDRHGTISCSIVRYGSSDVGYASSHDSEARAWGMYVVHRCHFLTITFWTYIVILGGQVVSHTNIPSSQPPIFFQWCGI